MSVSFAWLLQVSVVLACWKKIAKPSKCQLFLGHKPVIATNEVNIP